MIRTPPEHQTDPAKMPGQIVNRHDQTIGDYIARRNHDAMDDMAGIEQRGKSAGVSAEEKQALLDNQWKPSRDLPQGWDHV